MTYDNSFSFKDFVKTELVRKLSLKLAGLFLSGKMG